MVLIADQISTRASVFWTKIHPRFVLQFTWCIILSMRHVYIQGVKQVLVKLGAKGSALFIEGEEPIKQPIILAPRVLDTTGAGDTFTAAFAVALVEGKSKTECLRFAGMLELLSVSLFSMSTVCVTKSSHYCSSSSLSVCTSEGSHSKHAWQEIGFESSSISLTIFLCFSFCI